MTEGCPAPAIAMVDVIVKAFIHLNIIIIEWFNTLSGGPNPDKRQKANRRFLEKQTKGLPCLLFFIKSPIFPI